MWYVLPAKPLISLDLISIAFLLFSFLNLNIGYEFSKEPSDTYFRASDFFQDWWAEVTRGENGGTFSEMMGPSISN